jgi:hypothetical protein
MVFWWFFRGEFVVFSWLGDAPFRPQKTCQLLKIFFLIVGDADPVPQGWQISALLPYSLGSPALLASTGTEHHLQFKICPSRCICLCRSALRSGRIGRTTLLSLEAIEAE